MITDNYFIIASTDHSDLIVIRTTLHYRNELDSLNMSKHSKILELIA